MATRSSSWRPTWTFRARIDQPCSVSRFATRASASSPSRCAAVRFLGRAPGWPSTAGSCQPPLTWRLRRSHRRLHAGLIAAFTRVHCGLRRMNRRSTSRSLRSSATFDARRTTQVGGQARWTVCHPFRPTFHARETTQSPDKPLLRHSARGNEGAAGRTRPAPRGGGAEPTGDRTSTGPCLVRAEPSRRGSGGRRRPDPNCEFQRGQPTNLRLEDLGAIAAAVGQELGIRSFPSGDPIRDALHARLLDRFRRELHPSLRWHTRGAAPQPGRPSRVGRGDRSTAPSRLLRASLRSSAWVSLITVSASTPTRQLR